MNRQPTLDGDRLTLRPLRPEDWAALFAVACDPGIWALHPAHDRWQEQVFRRFFDEALESGGALAVTQRHSGAIIGSSRYGLPGVDALDAIEIGWTFLAHSHWGKGYNAEMKRLMIVHALPYFERVIFQVGIDNVVSRGAMVNIGGILTGRVCTHERGGVLVDHVVYEVTRESFPRSPLARR